MGNGNKINSEKNSKANELVLFLGDELEALHRSKQVEIYDLNAEYAKTRKNVLWPVWITLGVTFVAVAIIIACIVGGISAMDKRMQVNLSVFEEMNMKNLVARHAELQEKLENARQNKSELQETLDASLEQAKSKMQKRLENVQSESKRQEIQSKYEAEVKEIHDELDEKISKTERSIQFFEKRLLEFDKDQIAAAKEWQGSEQQIQQLEKQQLTKNFDNRLLSYIRLLNNLPVEEGVAGFILNPSAEQGVEIYVRRDSYRKAVHGVAIDVYDGKNKIASGVVSVEGRSRYIVLDNAADKERLAIGNTIRLSKMN